MRTCKLAIAFAAIALLATTLDVSAQETVTVEPAAVVSWQEMLDSESARSAARPERTVAPFEPFPEPREIPAGGAPSRVPARLPVGSSEIFSGERSYDRGPTATDNFEALGDNGLVIPPDTIGAAGPNHLMTMLNSEVRIQNKTGANLSTVSLDTFWGSLSGDPFDPKILYDSIHNRWLATCDADARSAASKVFFAISTTSDPTGAWTFYSITADSTGSTWADYPGFGFNQTWVAITNNMFTVSTPRTFQGAKMWVFDKAGVLAGGAATLTTFAAGFDTPAVGFTLKPCVTFGSESTLYIVDNSGYFLSSSPNTHVLRISEITGTGPVPVWSATAGSTVDPASGLFPVANDFDFNQIDASQLGTTIRVNTNDPRMLNAVFRNGHIWCTHSAGLPNGSVDRTAVFWYELDPDQMIAAGAPIVQSGVIDGGAGVHYFFPSISANANSDVCVGFSRSDATTYVEGVYTSRFGTDPSGHMDTVSLLKAGEDSYVKDFDTGRVRWGDYSGTVVDPTDDLTFWTIQEYAKTDVGPNPDDDRWGTWWGKIPSVARILTVSITGNGSVTLDPPITTITPPGGAQTYPPGETVSLTASPDTGWAFDHWEGDLTGSTNPATVSMSNDTNVTAVFAPAISTFTLTLAITGNGTVNLDPPDTDVIPPGSMQTYPAGTTVTLTATPDSGWLFTQWDGDATGVDTTTTVTMDSDRAVTAVFEAQPLQTFTMDLSIDGTGSVNVTPPNVDVLTNGAWTYDEGTYVVLTAERTSPTSVFDYWEVDDGQGAGTSTQNPLIVAMNRDYTIRAVFVPGHLLSMSVSPVGAGETDPPIGDHGFPDGATVQVRAIELPHSLFGHWEGDLTGTANPSHVVMGSAKAITAVFNPASTLYISATPAWFAADITNPPLGPHKYPVPTDVTVSATPSTNGWQFARWELSRIENGSTVPLLTSTANPIVVSLISSSEDYSLQAVYEEIRYSLTVNVVGGGRASPGGTTTWTAGTSVPLSAMPDPGWIFDRWEGDVNPAVGAGRPSVTMNADKTVTAVFVRVRTLTMEVHGSGTTDPPPGSSPRRDGETVPVSATASGGWRFNGWQFGLSGSDNPTSIVMNGDKKVLALFVQEDTSGDGGVVPPPSGASFQCSSTMPGGPSGGSPTGFAAVVLASWLVAKGLARISRHPPAATSQ